MKLDAFSWLRISIFELALAIFPFHADSAAAEGELRPPSEQVELLVKLRADAPLEDGSPHDSIGATVIRSFDAIGWQLVRLPNGMSASEGLTRYKAHPAVAAAELNGVVRLSPPPPVHPEPIQTGSADSESKLNSPPVTVIPNDPQWSRQWNLRKIGMPGAWEVTTGNSNVVVAILDYGVDYTHPDLRENIWRNLGETGLDSKGEERSRNGIDDDENGYVDDVHGIDTWDKDSDPMDLGALALDLSTNNYHGTPVAGILAARGDNGTGIAGVCWSVKVMAVRVFGLLPPGSSGPRFALESDMVEGFEYVIQQHRRGVNVCVMNHSWGGGEESRAIYDAIEVAGKEGILSVVAAPNEPYSTDIHWDHPGGYDSPYILSVVSVDSSDQLAPWSAFGKSTVDLAAPGRDVYTLSKTNGILESFSGNSGASPHVVGAAALLLGVHPEATPLEIKAALMHSVDPISSLRGKVATNGRLNVHRALQAITNSNLPPIVLGAFPGSPHTRTNAEIEIWFSDPMDRASVEAALQFSPPIPGTIEWEDSDRLLRLRPSSPIPETNYSARILGTAQDLSGRRLDGDFNRSSDGSPSDDFVWSFRFAPANDAFANALELSGTEGFLRADNSNSSTEEGEPNLMTFERWTWGPSLWYRWTATTDGWMTFDSSGTSLDTILSAYSGETLASLVELGRSDDFGARKGGRLSLPVYAGSNYFIRLGGTSPEVAWNQTIGPSTFSWYPTPAPTLTAAQFSPKSAVPNARITLFGTNFTGANEVLFGTARADFTPGLTNNEDLRITAIVPPDAVDGPITVRTPHGDVASTAEFTLTPPALTITSGGEGALEISWPATSPMLSLESTEALENAVWDVVESVSRTNGMTIYKPAQTEERTFFRLKKN